MWKSFQPTSCNWFKRTLEFLELQCFKRTLESGYPPRTPPRGGTRGGYPDPPGGVPGQVPPPGGVPGQVPPPGGVPGQVPPRGGGVPGPPPRCPMAFWEMLQSIMGYGYPPRCGQTNKVKLLPSRRTTYAGGKNTLSENNLIPYKEYSWLSNHTPQLLSIWQLDKSDYPPSSLTMGNIL